MIEKLDEELDLFNPFSPLSTSPIAVRNIIIKINETIDYLNKEKNCEKNY